MSIVTDAVLKTYFESGDVPTAAQFIDLVDSKVNGAAEAVRIDDYLTAAQRAQVRTGTYDAGVLSAAQTDTAIAAALAAAAAGPKAIIWPTGTLDVSDSITPNGQFVHYFPGTTIRAAAAPTSFTRMTSSSGGTYTDASGDALYVIWDLASATTEAHMSTYVGNLTINGASLGLGSGSEFVAWGKSHGPSGAGVGRGGTFAWNGVLDLRGCKYSLHGQTNSGNQYTGSTFDVLFDYCASFFVHGNATDDMVIHSWRANHSAAWTLSANAASIDYRGYNMVVNSLFLKGGGTARDGLRVGSSAHLNIGQLYVEGTFRRPAIVGDNALLRIGAVKLSDGTLVVTPVATNKTIFYMLGQTGTLLFDWANRMGVWTSNTIDALVELTNTAASTQYARRVEITSAAPTHISGQVDVGFAAVDAGADTFTLANHQLNQGEQVRVTTSGTLPGGLAVDTTYFVEFVSTSVFKLTSDLVSVVDITSQGTGTHSFHVGPVPFTFDTSRSTHDQLIVRDPIQTLSYLRNGANTQAYWVQKQGFTSFNVAAATDTLAIEEDIGEFGGPSRGNLVGITNTSGGHITVSLANPDIRAVGHVVTITNANATYNLIMDHDATLTTSYFKSSTSADVTLAPRAKIVLQLMYDGANYYWTEH